MRQAYSSVAAAASAVLAALACWPRPLMAAPPLAAAPLIARERHAEGAAASLAVAIACTLALGGHGGLLALAALLLVPASMEASPRLAAGPLAASLALAGYAGLYSYALYTGVGRAVDLPPYTVEALSEPGARAGLAILAGAYGALLAYSISRPSRAVPRLLGPGGLAGALRRHRSAPLWIPLLWLLAKQRVVVALPAALAVAVAAVAAYARTESLDASLAASYVAAALMLWLLGGVIPS